jgi:hypothetical protein
MRRALGLLLAALLLLAAPGVRAEDIRITATEIAGTPDGLLLSADFAFEFTPRLQEALNQGIPLYFVIDFELSRRRWYWFDELLLERSQKLRLWYHALTRQYRLSGENLYQSFESLAEARQALSHLQHWVLAEPGLVRPGSGYRAALRMRLDTAELPKPFQASALASRDWTLASAWYRWTLAVPEPGP